MSARNRELLALVPASLLLTAGFAAVFIAARRRADERLADLRRDLPRAVPGRARRPALHAALRRPVPVPARRGARVLRARDDLPDRRRRSRASRRSGSSSGWSLFAATIILLRDYRVLERYRYTIAAVGHRAAAAAARARDRPAGQRRLPRRRARPAHLPAGRVREDRDHHLPGELPARHAPAAGHRGAARGRDHDPAAQALRPAARRLGRGDGDARLHPRPRLVADVLRRLPGDPLRRDEPLLVRGHRPRRCSPAARGSSTQARPTRHDRVDAWLHPFGALYDQVGRQLPDRAVALRAGRRRAASGRASARRCSRSATRRCCRRRRPTSSTRSSSTSSGWSAPAPCCCTYLLVVERGFKIAMLARDSFSKLLATGLTAVFALQVFVIVGGVTKRDPADRRDAAVHLLRRLVDPRELRAARAAAARLRPRPGEAGSRDERADRPPLRRRSCVLFGVLVALHVALDGLRGATRCATTRRTAASCSRSSSIRRGAIRAARRHGARALASSAATARYARRYPTRPAVRPRGRLLASCARAAPASSASTTTSCRRRTGELGSLVDQLQGTRAGRRRPAHDARPRRPARRARSSLDGRKGAVVALDPRTGAVRVDGLASPATTRTRSATSARFSALNRDQDAPLLNRATQAGYPPGSTFKVVTAIAAIDSGQLHARLARQRATTAKRSPACRCNNDGGESFGDITLTDGADALGQHRLRRRSARSSARRTMAEVHGAPRLRPARRGRPAARRARRRAASASDGRSSSPPTARSTSGAWPSARTSCTVTPLQMAMVAAAVANGGVLMKPHLGDRIVDRDGRTVDRIEPERDVRGDDARDGRRR